ncbi:hypothetical protein OF83DRAFT_1169572 [Amylostereum chailletii]|nr:hypothetical protein OF83DRAFT_1169572 [Amylostereum chailletii]
MSTELKFQPPRTPEPYRRVREPGSPLARYGKSLPRKLPSLRLWKDVCQEHISVTSKSSPPYDTRSHSDNPFFSLRRANVPDPSNAQPQFLPISPRSRRVEALSSMRTKSLKRKLEDAGLELPEVTDGAMQCVLEAGRESRVKRARTGRLVAAERRTVAKAGGNQHTDGSI